MKDKVWYKRNSKGSKIKYVTSSFSSQVFSLGSTDNSIVKGADS